MRHMLFRILEKLYFRDSVVTQWFLRHTHLFDRLEAALDIWCENQTRTLEEFF